MDHLPAAVCRVTIEGRILYCNNEFASLFGFSSPGDIVGTQAVRLYRNPKDRGRLVQSVLQRGQVLDAPVAFRKRTGEPIWCGVSVKAVLDEDGAAVFLDGLLRDITGEIQESIAGLYGSAASAASQQAVFTLDVSGRFMDGNAAALQLLGIPASELPGRALADFLPEFERDMFLMLLGDIRKLKRTETVWRLRDAGGTDHLVECMAVLVRCDGRDHHVKVVASDVTDRLLLARENRNAEKFQGVLEMAGGVAHRLNQPLTVVTNILTETLRDMARTDRFYPNIQKAHVQVLRLNEITAKVANIRKYASIDYVAGVKIVDIDQAS
jgi:PAS domain S-box-containing protein